MKSLCSPSCVAVSLKSIYSPPQLAICLYTSNIYLWKATPVCAPPLPTTHLTPSGHQSLPPQPLTPTTQVDLAQTYLASRTWEQHVPPPSGIKVYEPIGAPSFTKFDFDLISLDFTWFNWQHRRARVEVPPTVTISSRIIELLLLVL